MDKERFSRILAEAAPLPLDDIALARSILAGKIARARKVDFAGTIDDIEIHTAYGATRVRVYTPDGRGPFPVILYMHGGGFCLGNPDLCDSSCRIIAASAEAVLVSVDYLLAPEHKFPDALEECYAIAAWLQENDTHLNICSDHLVVAGDSAGGNLAAALCLLARDRQEFRPAYQLLICPLLDQQTDPATKIGAADVIRLPSENGRRFRSYYFRDEDDGVNPLLSPLLAANLTGLPPATIVSAGRDPLATEALTYGKRLLEAGVDVRQRHYEGHVHDFVLYVGPLKDAAEVAAQVGRDIAEHFVGN